MRLDRYRTLVFDCDGVVLNSNPVKTEAFREAALPYGEASAQALVDYHRANGGISRYRKFRHFLETIVSDQGDGPDLDSLLEAFAANVRRMLRECDVAEGLMALRERTRDSRWLMVSGGDQAELRDVFIARGLAELFDGGIFGSPDTKDEILTRELANGNIVKPALFIGDSRYDHEAASGVGLDFVFLSQWTEFDDYRDYFESRPVHVARNLNTLLREETHDTDDTDSGL